MKNNLIFFFALFFSIFFSYSVSMANEEAKYDVVKKQNGYEIRLYQDRLIVQAVMEEESGAFRELFKYINGANNTSEKIKMTIPVTQMNKNNTSVMQFYLPSKFSKKNFIKHSNILRQKLIEDKISVEGFAIKATYNAPFTPPPFRRNEVMFRIDWKK